MTAVAVLAAALALLGWWRRAALVAELKEARRAASDASDRLAADTTAAVSRKAELEDEIAKLIAARDRLGQALDRLPLPVWRRNEDLEIIDCNARYAQAVEADRERVRREALTLGGQGMAARAKALAELATAAQTPQSEEGHAVIAGSRRRLEFVETPLPGGGTVGIALDMTEREDIQREFARHVSAHGEVLENLATAIAIYGSDQRLKFFNTAFAQLWNLDENWLRNEPGYGEVLEVLREKRRLPEYADWPAFKRQRLKLFTSLLDPLEELIYIPDGTTLHSRVAPHPMGGLLFTFDDVTDRLSLERSYNTLIAVQRETLDHLYEGVAVIGSDGRIKLTNPAYARMWQLSPEDLADEPHIANLIERGKGFFDHRGDWAAYKERIIARMTAREPRAGRLERTDGSVLDYATVPLPDGAVLLSYLDVSDTSRVETALRERAEALEAADRLKSEFISSVSYELRTPLNTIIGFAEILANLYFGSLNPRQLEYCRGILVSSERLLSIIDDMLDLASIEAGKMSLDLSTVDPRALVDEVAAVMQDMARSQDLRLAAEYPIDMAAIEGDERRLKQALCNLVSNAIKFTPAGGSIKVSAQPEGDMVRFAVSDTGVGIPPEEQARVFEAFTHARPAGERGRGRQTGPGLGLSLVKHIFELHGGRVWIESSPGRGTTVICTVPSRSSVFALAQPADTARA
ncbi:MAG TPA: ATP-binding protein [Alphaproteobacteria bacterium]|nr:ATP-binding protein [Alphaproteobacteria bacterium]